MNEKCDLSMMVRHTHRDGRRITGWALALMAFVFVPTLLTPAQAAIRELPPHPRPSYEAPPRPSDSVLYQQVFELQSKAKWRAADHLIAQITDPLLLGHVYRQRYMHPTAYRSSWKELRNWLSKYSDHPGAWALYELAKKRRPRGAAMPTRPPSRVFHQARLQQGPTLFRTGTARRIAREVRRLVRRERPTQAYRYITAPARDRHLTASETDDLKALIARSYYIEGKPKIALKIAEEATRSRHDVPEADWHAGLAAWRLGDEQKAVEHFTILAEQPDISAHMRSAALFWTARAYYTLNDMSRGKAAMERAASGELTFYNLVARYVVNGNLHINWHDVEGTDHNKIAHYPAVIRAHALDQAGQRELAELELLYLQERLSEDEARAILALAQEMKYPAVELAIATRLGKPGAEDQGDNLAVDAHYPVVDANELGELSLDRALLFALIRQESRFKARAKSRAGARGLMQIMPRTAAFVTGDRSLARKSGRDQLLDSETNIAIGQTYLSMLLSPDYFDNNLIYALASYNAGPGNLKRWRRELGNINDPLLFIESMSAPETRRYVQHVLSNLWIYRDRLEQEPISLRLLTAQSWPSYVAQDRTKAPAKTSSLQNK